MMNRKLLAFLLMLILFVLIAFGCVANVNDLNSRNFYDLTGMVEFSKPFTDDCDNILYECTINNNIGNLIGSTLTLIKDDENYRIFWDDENMFFRYEVFNNYRELIDSGYHGWRGNFELSFNDDDILVLHVGFGGSLWSRRYYDVTNSRVSRLFHKPIQTQDELIAYFRFNENNGDFVLVIQNMFDPSLFYMEVKRDFSIFVYTMPAQGEFSENGEKFTITYWLNPDDREVTEVLNLRNQR